MAIDAFTGPFITHEVTNQAPPLEDANLFTTNRPLVEGLDREGGAWAHDRVVEVGRAWGEARTQTWGRQANEHPPKLVTHDRFGNRADEVEFHPAYHMLMAQASEHELHALPWNHRDENGHVARAAMYMCSGQADAGHGCPITMTFAAVPALRHAPELYEEWVPRLTAPAYDPVLGPDKASAK